LGRPKEGIDGGIYEGRDLGVGQREGIKSRTTLPFKATLKKITSWFNSVTPEDLL
jgi:hypothetical protein